ncbi:MAG: sulfite exporter TauE/SafE family protein [Pseudomonadales bacterium]
MSSADMVSAFMLGLLGSGHCLSMCGGVHGLLLLDKQPQQGDVIASSSPASFPLLYVPLFSIGRVMSYGLAGLALGSVSFSIQSLGFHFAVIAKLLAGLMLAAMACYTGRWWMGLTKLEALTSVVWRYLQPATSSLMRPSSPQVVFMLGALWGWMPCGLVYSALSWSMLSPDPVGSAALMLIFGVGTLPAMLAAGLTAQRFVEFLNNSFVRNSAALMLLVFALWTIGGALSMLLADGSMAHHH